MIKSWLNPKWRIWLFLISANVAWLTAAWLWVDRENWSIVMPIALSIIALLVTYDQVLQFRVLDPTSDGDEAFCQPLEGQDPWGLLQNINLLCERLDVARPSLFLVNHPSAQFFTYARTQKSARLYITKGAIDLLTPRQMRAMLTYELITIKYSYHVLNYWVAALLDLIFRSGKLFERAFAFIFGWTPPLASWWIRPWLILLHIFLIGREDFCKLDREAAQLVDHPDDLAYALWKINSYAQTRPWKDSWAFAHMFVVSPLKLNRSLALVKVQPSLKGRIKRIAGRYPL